MFYLKYPDPVPCDPVPYDPVPYDPAPYDLVPYDPVPYGPVPYDPIPYYPVPYDATPWITVFSQNCHTYTNVEETPICLFVVAQRESRVGLHI